MWSLIISRLVFSCCKDDPWGGSPMIFFKLVSYGWAGKQKAIGSAFV